MIGADKQINHPGRKLTLQNFNYHCIAATPPSKGGEMYYNHSFNYTMLRLMAVGAGGLFIREGWWVLT